MLKKKQMKNIIFSAVLLAGLGLLWSFVYLGTVSVSAAGISTLLAALALITAFAVHHPETGKTIAGAFGGAWIVCGTAVKVIDLKNPTVWLNTVLARFHVALTEQVLLFTAFVVFFSLFYVLLLTLGITKDTTAMGIHPEDGDPEFREKSFAEKNRTFCEILQKRIETLNEETYWDENLFVPMDAEVEVVSRNRRKRRYEDLLRCLKKNRRGSTVYLVLGDPGSGKSVSLRKLCLDLLKEAGRTGKTPVYINLKQWNRGWNQRRLPDQDDLIAFVEKQLRDNGTFLTDEFLDQYFRRMLEDGRWYFVFDSFDEMPCLMGEGNHQLLIQHISGLLFHFLTGPNQSGGVIASRLYKAPSEALGAAVTLRIQDFNDVKMKTMLDKSLIHTRDVIQKLFGGREDLVSICRNPFYLTLLRDYIKGYGTEFPDNQMTLYESFVEGRLKRCAAKLQEEQVTEEELYRAAMKLAYFMQESTKYGLECPASELYRLPEGRTRWRKWLILLAYAKLCRFGGSEETVSFVHRRFQEFFMVREMMEHEREFDYQEIIVGDRGSLRDALVLYCEVAEPEKAREIARFCWQTVQEKAPFKDSILHREAVTLANTLEFMTEAFRNRREAAAEFREDFEEFVTANLDDGTDFVIQTALIHSMALLDQPYLQKIVLRVFEMGNRWLDDEVMKNCRLIETLDPDVEEAFVRYFRRMRVRDFLRRFENTRFALSIPDGFRYVRRVHMMNYVWYASWFAALFNLMNSLSSGVFTMASGDWFRIISWVLILLLLLLGKIWNPRYSLPGGICTPRPLFFSGCFCSSFTGCFWRTASFICVRFWMSHFRGAG